MTVKQHFTITLPVGESYEDVVLDRGQAEDLLVDLGSALYPHEQWGVRVTPTDDDSAYGEDAEWTGGADWAEPELGSPATYGMSVEEAEKKLAEQQAVSPIQPRPNSGSGIGVRHIQ